MLDINEGSFVKIDYVAMKKTDRSVFKTTRETIAKENGLYSEFISYEPELIVIGKKWVPKQVEEKLIGAKQNDKVVIEVPFQHGFGQRDPSKIRLVPRREFQKIQLNPQQGEWVTLGEQEGKIISVSPGRVRVDFNHKLAGEDLIYEVEIKEVINDELHKIQSLINRRLPGQNLADSNIELKGEKIIIELPKRVLFFEYIQFAKKNIARDLRNLINLFEEVIFTEHFTEEDLEQ